MYQPIRGTKDLLGDEYLKHLKIVDLAKGLANLYGYHPIETPIFESSAIFQKSLGETSDVVGKEMYTFLDKSENSITLRPEGTASVVRAFLTAGLSQKLPQKFFYYGPMFRYERPQKGRYRQFYQIGVECLGWHDPHADADCIMLADHILKQLKIDTILHINSLGDEEDRMRYRTALLSYLAPYENDLSLESQKRLNTNPLRILDSKNKIDQEICQQAPVLVLSSASLQFFDIVCETLSFLGVSFVHDKKLVRGLDYYVHTAFEFKSKNLGAQDTILGGGKYNGLAKQMGGPDVPGIGWAMGVERALLLSNLEKEKNNDLVAILPVNEAQKKYCLSLALSLRAQGIKTEMIASYDDLGKRLKCASRLCATWCIVVGEDELAKSEVQVKYFGDNVSIAKNQSVAINSIADFFRGCV